MRTFSKKKKLPRLLTLCGAVAVSALLGGCGQSGVPAESFDRSDYYTRGIGSYPGDPGFTVPISFYRSQHFLISL